MKAVVTMVSPGKDDSSGVLQPPNSSSADETNSDSSGVIELINRVRELDPNCLQDLIPDSVISELDRAESPSFRLEDNLDTPTSIGRFEIVDKLGEGGFGLVYLANDPELERHVALKIPRAETLLSEEARHRFLQEGKAAAKLSHPNIASVLEAGKIGPIYYIVTAWCRGGSLAEYIHRHPPLGVNSEVTDSNTPSDYRSTSSPVPLILALADAVQHAHERGILHRDLKPGNILFDKSDGQVEDSVDPSGLASAARIVDFGLAKVLDAEDQHQTRTGAALGTPNYMSPEQASGDNRAISVTTDIYSLGAILYELLTGRPPFQKASQVETLVAVKQEEPLPPRRLVKRVHKDLEAICLKCLEKKPGLRYASAAMLAEDLERFQRGEPVLARRSSTLRSIARWCTRYPFAAVLAVLVVALALCGPVVAIRQNQLYRNAVDAREQANRTLYVSDMNLAFRDWDEANLERCGALLQRHASQSGETDYRGFEWYYLHHQWQHADSVPVVTRLPNSESMALSPNDTLIAIGSHEGKIKLFDRRTGREIATWQAHPYATSDLQFSADGKRLASANIDQEAKIWDVESREQVNVFSAERAITFSPVDDTLVFSTNKLSLGILGPGEELPKIIEDAHGGQIWDIAFAPDGNKFASVGWDGALQIWDVASSERLKVMPGDCSLWAVAWSPNGQWIATGDTYGRIRIYDGEAAKEIASIAGHDAAIRTLSFSSDSQVLQSAAEDSLIKRWALPSGSSLATLRGHHGPVVGLAATGDGRTLLSAGSDGDVRSWDTGNSNQVVSELAHPKAANAVAFSPDGLQLATTCFDGKIRTWNTASGELTNEFTAHDAVAWQVAYFKMDGRLALASTGSDDALRVWNPQSGQLLREIASRPNATNPLPLAVSSDGSKLAFADSESSAVLYDIQSGNTLFRFQSGGVSAIKFSPDDQFLVLVSSGNTVRVYDVENGQECHNQDAHSRAIMRLAFSADGSLLATGSHDRSVMLWHFGSKYRSATLKLRHHLTGPGDIVDGMAFSPDGKVLATAGGDRVIRIWDVSTGQQRAALTGHASGISDLAFSPAGETLASAGYDHTVRLWRAPRLSP